MRNLDNEDIEIIRSYINDGYTDNEICELADYTIDQVKYAKRINTYKKEDSYSRLKGNKTFSDQTVNVFCKFLNQGCSNEELYDIFHLWNKISRKYFYTFCEKLRNKKAYTYITENYDIPLLPTKTYESKFSDKDFIDVEFEEIKSAAKFNYEESKRLQRKKSAELDRIKTQEAIKRMEEELKAKEKSTNNVKAKEKTNDIKEDKKKVSKAENKISAESTIVNTNSAIIENTGDDATYSQINRDFLPRSTVNMICKLISNGYTDSYISNKLSVPKSEVSSIRNGKEYVYISKNYGIIPSKKKDAISDLIKSIE